MVYSYRCVEFSFQPKKIDSPATISKEHLPNPWPLPNYKAAQLNPGLSQGHQRLTEIQALAFRVLSLTSFSSVEIYRAKTLSCLRAASGQDGRVLLKRHLLNTSRMPGTSLQLSSFNSHITLLGRNYHPQWVGIIVPIVKVTGSGLHTESLAEPSSP